MAQKKSNVLMLEIKQPYLDEASTKALTDRLSRVEGHVRSLKQMVLDHRCADEILLQVAAVKGALNQVSSQILDYELTACMELCMNGSSDERLRKATKVLATLMRQT